MPNTKNTHINQNILQNQRGLNQEQKPHGDVWQDKDALLGVRAERTRPVMFEDTRRTPQMSTNTPRSQTVAKKHRLVQIAFWTEEPIREQILYLAKSAGLSISQTTGALVKEILRERFHKQQAATLPELIERAVAKANRTLAKRLVSILIRIAFDTGQTRVIATNLLGRTPGMTEGNIKGILEMADKHTKTNLTRKTPQLTEAIEAIEKWLLETEEDEKVTAQGKEAKK
jgi:hypothetical protein